jgi:hypothetical protein
LYTFFLIPGSHGLGEKTLVIGADATWSTVETRVGIAEVSAIRPNPVLALSSAPAGSPPGNPAFPESLDMAVSFDEDRPDRFSDRTGHYRVSAGSSLSAADPRLARNGTGAAFFSGNSPGNDPLVITPRDRSALLSPGRHIMDFSVEFWLYPMFMENGEQILTWTAVRETARGERVFQRIQCEAARNRLQWTFQDFFSGPGGGHRINLTLGSSAPILPKAWSHHLIRFDAATGLFEYLVNGRLESVLHTTASGREGGDVYTPIIGEDPRLVLGSRYMGLVDELRIHGEYVERSEPRKYPSRGGRMETRPLDLIESGSTVLRVDAFGGRFSVSPRSTGRIIQNEYTGNGGFRFADEAAMKFFIRAADNPYLWTESEWRAFEPGTGFSDTIRGRFVQLAAVFYPGEDGETTPYLDEMRISYLPNNPPRPPSMVNAVPRDGAVDLSWRASSDQDTAGYMVYYGTARGEYFGGGAILGASPINVGKRTAVRIDGLENGVLYYFAVTAYDREHLLRGEFSREVSARPLRMAP